MPTRSWFRYCTHSSQLMFSHVYRRLVPLWWVQPASYLACVSSLPWSSCTKRFMSKIAWLVVVEWTLFTSLVWECPHPETITAATILSVVGAFIGSVGNQQERTDSSWYGILQFARCVLHVKSTACNTIVYGECDRFSPGVLCQFNKYARELNCKTCIWRVV